MTQMTQMTSYTRAADGADDTDKSSLGFTPLQTLAPTVRIPASQPNRIDSGILYKSLRDNALRGQLSDVPYRDFIWMRQLS